MKHPTQIGQQYFQSLQAGDIEAICQLFADDGVVHSPLYGIRNHRDFYTELMEDSGSSTIDMKRIFSDPESGDLAIWFRYDWGLDNGERVVFEGVDVFELNDNGKIKKLTIIYDTVNTREMVGEMKKNSR